MTIPGTGDLHPEGLHPVEQECTHVWVPEITELNDLHAGKEPTGEICIRCGKRRSYDDIPF